MSYKAKGNADGWMEFGRLDRRHGGPHAARAHACRQNIHGARWPQNARSVITSNDDVFSTT